MDPEIQSPPASHRARVIGAALLLALAGVAAWQLDSHGWLTLETLNVRHAELALRVAEHPTASAALFFVVYAVAAALAMPGALVLTLAAGALFGFVEAVALVSFASSIGASMAFLTSRRLLREPLRRSYREKLDQFDEGIRRDGALYLLSLRLVPAIPFFLVNVLAGLSPLRLRTFYPVSQIGMLPATVAYVYAGRQLAVLHSPSDVLSPSMILALLLLGAVPIATKGALQAMRDGRANAGHRRPSRFDYNVVVIGAGSAGLVASYIGSTVGAKVALIERDRMGGDCLNTGCVPSKALLRSAHVAAQVRDAKRYGVSCGSVDVDFAAVMQRIRDVIARVEPHDSRERYTGMGVDVISGDATIRTPWAVEVCGRTITARSIVLATGAKPTVPPIAGLDAVEPLTSDTVWNLRERPHRLLVLGGGPIGCELAQAFARLGCTVVLVERADRLLVREDPEASACLKSVFDAEGIDVRLGHSADRVEAAAGGSGTLVCTHDGVEVRIPFDRILVALGRTPNAHGFGLEVLGVRIEENRTVGTNAFLRTSVPSIFAAGDVAGPYQFTHVAGHQAGYAVLNALLRPWWRFRQDLRVVPWATFTDPEIARVGLTEGEAREKGIAFEVTRYGLDDLDRAIADGRDSGFVKVVTAHGSDRILGATIVGARAPELLAELVLAMKHGLGLSKLLSTIHVYPTYSEANRFVAGSWKRAHAPQRLLQLAARYFAMQRH
ncbi:FAD-dependent oxidoreductase [Lysobacter xanthus]